MHSKSMDTDPSELEPFIPDHLQNSICPHSPTGPPDFVPKQKGANLPFINLPPAAENKKPTLRPIAILIEELTKEDIQIRLNAMRQLHTIAKALGPSRTVSELIPYLTDMIDDDDEVLVVMCKELLNLIPWVGGPENVHHLLKPYETLCVVEETNTRDFAIEGASKVLEQVPTEICETVGFNMLTRLLGSDWHTARVSGSLLAPAVYGRVGQAVKENIEKIFLPLANDTMPMVRRAVVQATSKFLAHLSSQTLRESFLPVFVQLCKDDQDGVRLLAVKTLSEFRNSFNVQEAAQFLRLCVCAACLDTSWRVRYVAADNFVQLCDLLGLEWTKDRLLDNYVKLLRDGEAEVRAAAVAKCGEICKRIGEDLFVEKVTPVLKILAEDDAKYTRASLANSIIELFHTDCLQKSVAIRDIVPIILTLLKDEFPEVRLNVIKNLESATHSFELKSFRQALLPSVRELSTDANWRVRTAIIALTPNLAKHLGQEFFEEIDPAPLSWMADQVSEVRQCAARNLTNLGKVLGDRWVVEQLIPNLIRKGAESPQYLQRIAVLEAMMHMVDTLSPSICIPLLKLAVKLVKDAVPNVRLKACATLEVFVMSESFWTNDLVDEARVVNNVLEMAVGDTDDDVAYKAKEVLQAMRKRA